MIELQNVPCNVILTNTGTKGIKVIVRPGSTQSMVIEAEDSIKLKVETSSELLAFYAQASILPDLVVTIDSTKAKAEDVPENK